METVPASFQGLTWFVVNVLCPLIVGMAIGTFARRLLAWLVVVFVGLKLLMLLLVLGGLKLDAEQTADSLGRLATMGLGILRILGRVLPASPVTLASAAIGIAGGILLREAWRRRHEAD